MKRKCQKFSNHYLKILCHITKVTRALPLHLILTIYHIILLQGRYGTSSSQSQDHSLNQEEIKSHYFYNDLYELLHGDSSCFRKICLFISSLSPSDKALMPDYMTQYFIDTARINTNKNIFEPHNVVRKIENNRFNETSNKPAPSEGTFLSYSKSKIWQEQYDYYRNSKLNAWESNDVPLLISSNRFVSNKILDIILNDLGIAVADEDTYHNECPAELNPTPRHVAIIELGAGHGLVSYHIAKDLYRLMASHPSEYIFHIICTDFHENTFRDLIKLPWINEMCETGLLDFAICTASTEDSSKLSGLDCHSGLRLLYSGMSTCEIQWSHVFIFGNYAFDSFPCDLKFKSNGGDIYEIGEWNLTSSIVFDAENEVHAKREKRNRKHMFAAKKTNVSPKGISHRGGETDNWAEETFANYSPGMYAVPVVGRMILQKIKESFPIERRKEEVLNSIGCKRRRNESSQSVSNKNIFSLIVGDYFMSFDDDRQEIRCLEEEIGIFLSSSGTNAQGSDIMTIPLKSYSNPMISPKSHICALPISIEPLRDAFLSVFCDCHELPIPRHELLSTDNYEDTELIRSNNSPKRHCENDSSKTSKLTSFEIPYRTLICGESFSFVQFFANVGSTKRNPLAMVEGDIDYFGPHGYFLIREYITENINDCVENIDLEFLFEFLQISQFDISLFTDLRWVILDKIIENIKVIILDRMSNFLPSEEVKIEILLSDYEIKEFITKWCQMLLDCNTLDQPFLSWNSLLLTRHNSIQWFLALRNKIFRAFIDLGFHKLSLSFGKDVCDGSVWAIPLKYVFIFSSMSFVSKSTGVNRITDVTSCDDIASHDRGSLPKEGCEKLISTARVQLKDGEILNFVFLSLDEIINVADILNRIGENNNCLILLRSTSESSFADQLNCTSHLSQKHRAKALKKLKKLRGLIEN